MAIIQSFKGSFPVLGKINDKTAFFNTCKELFPEYMNRNMYGEDESEAFYVYEQTTLMGCHTGLIALASLEDYVNGKIVKHEKTLAEKEKIMLRLLDERKGMIKPTVLTYPENKEITQLLEEYKKVYPQASGLCYLESIHKFWRITAEEHINKLKSLFNSIPKTYIADGHHRAATSCLRYEELKASNPNHKGTEYYNFLFSAYFSENQLKIHEYNRVVYTLNNYSTSGFRQELRKDFIIEKSVSPYFPASKYEMGMFIEQKWYKVVPKSHLTEGSQQEQLAVSIWNKYVLKKALNIQNVREDTRIKYIEGPKGIHQIEKKVGKSNFAVGFTFYPVEMKDLMAIADAGETMPPKSTFFTPRMRNGIITQLFS